MHFDFMMQAKTRIIGKRTCRKVMNMGDTCGEVDKVELLCGRPRRLSSHSKRKSMV